MVFKALQLISYVFSEGCKWKTSPFGRRKVASAECELCVVHITITLAIQWRRLGAGMQRLASAGPPAAATLANSINVVVYIGKQRLYKPRICHQFFTSSRIVRKRQNDDLRFRLLCEKCEWWGRRERAPVTFLKESFADEETCRAWYHIEHARRWLNQWVAILADQPLCGDELGDQLSSYSLPVDPLAIVSAAAWNSAGRPLRSGSDAHVMIDEHAVRTRPAVAVFEIC